MNHNESAYTSGYGPSGYDKESDESDRSGYGTGQGNYHDGYRENIYDQSNLADTAWTDSPANPNPQLYDTQTQQER